MNRFFKVFLTVTTALVFSTTAAVAAEEDLIVQAEKKVVTLAAPASFELALSNTHLFGGVVTAHTEREQERSIARKRAQALAWRHMASRAVETTALSELAASNDLVALLEMLPLWQNSTRELSALPYRQGADAQGRHWSLLLLSDSQLEELQQVLEKGISAADVEKLFMYHAIGLAYDARKESQLDVARRHFEEAFARKAEPPTDAVVDYCRLLASEGEKAGALRILDGLWSQRRHSMTAQQKQQFFELRDKILAP